MICNINIAALVVDPTGIPQRHRDTETSQEVSFDDVIEGLAAHRPLARERQLFTAKIAKIAKTIAKASHGLSGRRGASSLFNSVESVVEPTGFQVGPSHTSQLPPER
jgi:hypothetical protein